MKKATALFFAFVIFAGALIADGGKKYGKEITLEEKTELSAILENPADYEGEKVLVEGEIVGVCAHMGCWINIKGENEDEIIRVKVKDGEIVFPEDCVGKTALVEGVVEKVETEHEVEKESEHKEGEHESCEIDAVYQIRGIGAVISE